MQCFWTPLNKLHAEASWGRGAAAVDKCEPASALDITSRKDLRILTYRKPLGFLVHWPGVEAARHIRLPSAHP
jgi:hypothetical protein